MGNCCSCCLQSESEELLSPDAETRRRLQAEAAENRAKANEAKGLANPERVQRRLEQARAREEKLDNYASQSSTPVLKWQTS